MPRDASALLARAERDRQMQAAARMVALAALAERVLGEALRAEAERVALAAQVRELETRLAATQPGPLLPAAAFSRIQRTQQARADLREDLRRLRERYTDSTDAEG
jgi:hypothetical protein